jgi:aminoglycoside phosphotransferase (APT) family kinase protein
VDLASHGVTDAFSTALLTVLRREWGCPALAYQRRPQPLAGGFETSIFEFQLRGAPTERSGRLILRVFQDYAEPGKALRESIVQNAVAATGYPAPRVFLTCSDASLLGGEFNVMEKMPGDLMFTTPFATVPETLGRLHAALHQLDPAPVQRTLVAHGIDVGRISLQGIFHWVRRRIDAAGYGWLRPGLEWLLANRPARRRAAICHGDFHPLNILMQDGAVSGVLDWSGFRIADGALDVAATKVILAIAAPALVPSARTALSQGFVARYQSAYEELMPLSPESLRYYEVLRCIQALLEGADGQAAWRTPAIVTQLLTTVQEYAGLEVQRPSD